MREPVESVFAEAFAGKSAPTFPNGEERQTEREFPKFRYFHEREIDWWSTTEQVSSGTGVLPSFFTYAAVAVLIPPTGTDMPVHVVPLHASPLHPLNRALLKTPGAERDALEIAVADCLTYSAFVPAVVPLSPEGVPVMTAPAVGIPFTVLRTVKVA